MSLYKVLASTSTTVNPPIRAFDSGREVEPRERVTATSGGVILRAVISETKW